MRRRFGIGRCTQWVFAGAMVFAGSVGLSQAAYFSAEGSKLTQVDLIDDFNIALNTAPCMWSVTENPVQQATIVPGAGESNGDPVTISYCYSISISTNADAGNYQAVAGFGDDSLTISCPGPGFTPQYTNSNPAKLIINPGPDQQVALSLGPITRQGTSTYASGRQCGSIPARIGDVVQGNVKGFAAVSGPVASSGTNVVSGLSIRLNLPQPGSPVPTISEWGALLLSGLVVLLGAVYLRRRT